MSKCCTLNEIKIDGEPFIGQEWESIVIQTWWNAHKFRYIDSCINL